MCPHRGHSQSGDTGRRQAAVGLRVALIALVMVRIRAPRSRLLHALCAYGRTSTEINGSDYSATSVLAPIKAA
jgi:hypothetical protein